MTIEEQQQFLDHAAMMALTGYCSRENSMNIDPWRKASWAYADAYALLNERERYKNIVVQKPNEHYS